MRRPRLLPVASALAAVLVVQLAVGPPPASAHKHPTPVELISPAAVFVETRVKVEISLIEHDIQSAGAHILLHQFTYSPVLAEASGFAVDPSGVVVTDADVIKPDMRRAEIYAVNKAFADYYKVEFPKDPFAEQTTVTQTAESTFDPFVSQRLRTCYQPNTTDRTGGCVVASTPQVTVYPYVTSQQKYGALPATVLTKPTSSTRVAVLKVGASSMPTAPLAQSLSGAKAVAALGFTGIPSLQNTAVKKDFHFTAEGSGQANTTGEDAKGFYRQLVAGLDAGMYGGPVVAEKGQVVGFFPRPQPGTPLKVVDPAAIRAALTAASVTAGQGPTDAAFESAMHRYKNAQYTGAIPGLKQTLKLYPGHFDATRNLAVAESKQGTAADKTGEGLTVGAEQGSSSGGGNGWLTVAVVVLLVLVALALTLLLLARRRRLTRSRHGVPAAAPGASRAAAAAPGPASQAGPARPPAGSRADSGPSKSHAARTGSAAAPPDPRAPQGSQRAGTTGAAPGRAAQASPTPPRGGAGQAGQPGLSVMSAPSTTGAGPNATGGATPVPRTFCTNCGQRLAPNHRFCGWCGHHVD